MAVLGRILDGARAGAAATAAMSTILVAGDRAGLISEPPPTTITRSTLRDAGVQPGSETVGAVAPAAHMAFGAAGGAVFGLLRTLLPRIPGTLLGVVFGLALWAISYRGWIPAFGILPKPEHDRPGRPAVMIAAHVVYGLFLGSMVKPAKR